MQINKIKNVKYRKGGMEKGTAKIKINVQRGDYFFNKNKIGDLINHS
jgi:hypothetical protein